MSELSAQYACNPATGDFGTLTAENLAEARLFLSNVFNAQTGLIYWTDTTYVPKTTTTSGSLTNPVDGLLEPTEAGGVVSIDTGVALVNGYLYFNDAVVNFDIDGSPGNTNATDIIALRWTAASQTVRLVRLNGAISSTAVLTQTSTTWEVPIAEVLLDGSGQFSALTDVRKLAMPTNTPLLIDTQLGTGASGTITFNNIPVFFQHLKLVGRARSTRAASTADQLNLRFNNNSGALYDHITIGADTGGGAQVGAATTQTSQVLGDIVAATSLANIVDQLELNIIDYQSNVFKTASAKLATHGSGSSATFVLYRRNMWFRSVAPISRIDLFLTTANFATSTQFYLYGIV